MNTRVSLIAVALLALVIVVTGLMVTGPRDASGALTPDEHLTGMRLPDFELTNQRGETVTRDALLGEVTVLDFFFTRCPFICPPMSQNMLLCQNALEDSGVKLMSVSVDPQRDTPQRLSVYASELGADPSRWSFLTGELSTVTRLLTEGLMMAPPEENPSMPIELPDGESMNNIAHPSRFFLVGPNAEILGMYNGLNRQDVGELIERARRADAELSRRR